MSTGLQPFAGNIHTVSARAVVRHFTEPNIANSYRITGVYLTTQNGQQVKHMRFNPNKPVRGAKADRKESAKCYTLAKFTELFDDAMELEGVGGRADIVRVDFKADYTDMATVDLWVKFCNLLIGAFVVRHNVSDKNQFLCTTITGEKHKSTKAQWGKIVLENYNKVIQEEGEGICYRFEARYIGDEPVSVADALDTLLQELKGLATYYDQALALWNATLLEEYTRINRAGGTKVHPHAYVRCNENRMYSRKQLRDFFDRAYEGKIPTWADKHYCQKNHPLLISHSLFNECIKMLCEGIQAFKKGVPQHSILAQKASVEKFVKDWQYGALRVPALC